MSNQHILAGATTVRYAPFTLVGMNGQQVALPYFGGNIFFADYGRGSDVNGNGTYDSPFKTLSYAHSAMTADQDDCVYISGGASPTTYAFRESATLTWSKNRCHIWGLNSYNRVSHRVSLRVLSGTSYYSPFVNVTAQGCLFGNFHTFGGFTTASALVGWLDSGQRNTYYNMHFGALGVQQSADHASSIELHLSGSGGEHYFEDCTIGLDTVDRGGANSSLVLSGGNARNLFRNCRFIMRADATSPLFLTIGAGGIDRWLEFKGCSFINTGTFTGGSTLAQALSLNASAGGVVTMDPACQIVGITARETSASGVLYVMPAQANSTSNILTAAT